MMKKGEKKRYEVDLYKPVRQLFEEQGYLIHSEVNDCDVVAIKEEELVIIELKLLLNLELILQAVKRQRMTKEVYIAAPKPSFSLRSQKWRDLNHLIRRLELGLLFIHFNGEDATAEIVFAPTNFNRKKSMQQSNKRKNKLLTEIQERSGNYNTGGSNQKKIMTAYKENCIYIAVCLQKYGPLSPKQLRQIGTGDKTLQILNSNYYNWFERIKRGVYKLNEKGREEHLENEQVAEIYKTLVNEVFIENL